MKIIKFTPKQVEQVFNMRCDGMTHTDIGNRMNCSSNYIAHVLSRFHYSDVKIDDKLVKKAQTVKAKRKPNGKKNKSPSVGVVLAKYAEVLIASNIAYKACIEAGLSETAIKAFTKALMEDT